MDQFFIQSLITKSVWWNYASLNLDADQKKSVLELVSNSLAVFIKSGGSDSQIIFPKSVSLFEEETSVVIFCKYLAKDFLSSAVDLIKDGGKTVEESNYNECIAAAKIYITYVYFFDSELDVDLLAELIYVLNSCDNSAAKFQNLFSLSMIFERNPFDKST